MVRVKPFAAIRPSKDMVTEVAAPPYDVVNSQEAKDMAGEKSLQHTMEFVRFKENPDPVGARVIEGWALSDLTVHA